MAQRNRWLAGGVLSIMCYVGCNSVPDAWQGKWVDMSYPFDSTTIYWPTEEGFLLQKEAEGLTPKGYFYAANRFTCAEHGGTHMDAPYHFSADGQTTDKIPLDKLFGPGVVIDVSAECENNPNFQIPASALQNWEIKHNTRLDGKMVLFRTGYGKYWPNRKQYLGTEEKGPNAVLQLHFPGLHPEAARWLATERTPKAVGLDTASIDFGQSTLFESHVALLGRNIPVLENVASLDQLPEEGFRLLAFPMNIKGGSGGPVRIAAFLPN
ncbi:MAG: cyclase family protein [Terriglobia bacterium]